MKNYLLLGLLFLFSTQLMAVKPVHAPASEKGNMNKVESLAMQKKVTATDGGIIDRLLKKNKTVRKMVNWVKTKLLKKNAIDLDDPVMKWLWYAIILAIAATVLGIVFSFLPGILWIIPSLLGLAAGICFIYWLILFLDMQ